MEPNDTLLPTEEVDRLKREIGTLRRRQWLIEPPSDDMRSSMAAMSRSINSLLRVFKEASEDMKMDTHEAVLVSQKIEKILERLDKIEIQNEKIAKGIVAIADMIEDLQQDSLPRQIIPQKIAGAPPYPMQREHSGMPKPLPTYNIPPEEKKRSFMNLNI